MKSVSDGDHVNVGGEYFEVNISDEEEEPELENKHAAFLPEEGRIVLNEENSEVTQWRYLGHELMHATTRHIGLETLLIQTFKLTPEQACDLEEFICDRLSPAYLDTLERNGWLTPPVVK